MTLQSPTSRCSTASSEDGLPCHPGRDLGFDLPVACSSTVLITARA